MPEPSMDDVKALGGQILDIIKGAGKDFLDQNKAVKDLLIDRTEELAKLALKYKLEADADRKAELLAEMKIVQQTIQNELSVVALAGLAASREVFMKVVDTAIGAFIKFAPLIVGAL